MGVSLRINLPLEDYSSSIMSPNPMSEGLISAIPVLGEQDFNAFNLDEGILQNPDQHIGDIEEMLRSMDDNRLTLFPELEPEDFEDHNVDVYDSRVADYMWNCMDVKNSASSRLLGKTNVVTNPIARPRSLLRCNFNAATAPPPPPPPPVPVLAPAPVPVTVTVPAPITTPSLCLSDGGSEYSEDCGRPETPNSISDCEDVLKVEANSLVDLDDFSATHSVWGRNYVPESAFMLSCIDDDYLKSPLVHASEVSGQLWNSKGHGQVIKKDVWITSAATTTANWTKSEAVSSSTAPASPSLTMAVSSPSTTTTSATPATPATTAPPAPAVESPLPPRDPAAIAAATNNLFNDHSYPMNRNGYPRIPGNLTPSDSEEEIDVVNDFKTRPSRSSAAALPNNPTANDRKVLQRTVASKISPPQTPAASPAPSPPPSPPRRTPAIMGGPSLNLMRSDGERSLVRSKRECTEAITTRRRREIRAHAEDEEHVRRLRQRETGFMPQAAPAPIRKEVRVMNSGMVLPAATELRPDWLVVCHNKRDRFRKSRARIEQDAWQNVQSKKHRQRQAMNVRRPAMAAAMSDMDSDEEMTTSRRGRGSGASTGSGSTGRGAKRKHKRDLDSEERRSQHNHMERRRRVDLRESFEELRLQIPMVDGKAAKVAILEGAATRIRCLQNVEEQLLDEEDRLLKEYFNLRVRLLRLTLPARELEGWTDHDLVSHEVVSAVEKMETAEGIHPGDARDVHGDDAGDEEIGVDDDQDDDDEDEEEEEEEIHRPAAKRRRTRHRDSYSDSGDDDETYYSYR